MAGYSDTDLPRKLGIKDGQVVYVENRPDDVDLSGFPTVRLMRRLPRSCDVTLTFHTSSRVLARRLPTLFEHTDVAGMVWVCWPKKTAQKSLGLRCDLSDGVVRALGLELGFVDVKVAAINQTWSGLKFVRRLRDR